MPKSASPTTARDPLRRAWAGPLFTLVAVAVLAVHARSHLPFLADDALITLRYAERLLHGHGLTWTDGPPVEGYSNLLWLLGCAALGAAGIDLILAARILGFACSIGTVVLLGRAFGRDDAYPGLVAMLAFALCGPVAVWTVGGLEQPAVALLLAAGTLPALRLVERPAHEPGRRDVLLAAVPLALLCLTRPDGALLVAGASLGLLVARGFDRAAWRRAVGVATLPASAWFGQLAFRLLYYGEWFPNSAHAKVAFSLRRLEEGLEYVGAGSVWLAGLALPALAFAGVALRRRVRSGWARYLVVQGALWAAYVAIVGGDSFPARRHLVPLIVVACFLLGHGLAWLRAGSPAARRTAWVAGSLALFSLAGLQWADPQNGRARAERWEWDGQAIGGWLHEAFGDRQPLLAADAGGTLPYFSKLPSLDLLGLNDHHLAHHRPDDFGQGYLGHELGDGAYVLDREPDLVIFCGPQGSPQPCFRSGKEMLRDPRFPQRYRLVRIETGPPRRLTAQVWVRTDAGPLGLRRDETGVTVPGWLFQGNPRSAVRLNDAGEPGTELQPHIPAGFLGLTLPPGRWSVTATARERTPTIEIRDAATRATLAQGRGEAAFELPGTAAVNVLVGVPEGVAILTGARLALR